MFAWKKSMFSRKRSHATAVATDDFFLYRMGVVVPRNVTRVRIHPSVERIPENAFENRTDLVEVNLTEGLQRIGACAFRNCNSLHRINIPSSVTYIGNYAFRSCASLKEIDLAEGLLTIGNNAFYKCTSLLRIKIPSSVTAIGNHAFDRCTSLKEVNLTEGLQRIGAWAFQNCNSLHRIKVPSSVTVIDNEAFRSCASLKKVDLTEGLIWIGNGAFDDCTALLCIKIPSTVNSLELNTFRSCTSLKKVDLTEGLRSIGECAFKHCTSLLCIKIPSSVAAIGHWAFSRCMSLKTVNLAEGLRSIGRGAFTKCYSLHRINVPPSVTAIGNGAFFRCTSLKEVDLTEGRLRTIEGAVFQQCTSLLSIIIPSTVNRLNLKTFHHCTLLRNVVIAPSFVLRQDVFVQSFPSLQNMGFSLEMIIGRFDELPLHEHCYYYRSQLVEQTMDSTTWKLFNEEVGRLPAHGLQQDCFGMTPLHVLLCSSAGCDVRVCQCMIEKYPGAMLIEDKWGEVPLVYALLGEAPIEVIHFLLDTHMQRWQAMPFDFGGMILRLATKRGTSADYVRDVIQAQRTHHHALEIDWQRIVRYSIRARYDIPIRMFSVLVEASVSRMFSVLVEAGVSKRSIGMSEEHRIEVDARLHEISVLTGVENDEVNIQYYEEIRDMVTSYVRLHHGQLRESMTILELALWKTMICSKVDDQESRSECRTSGGRCLEVVIKHVLAFL